MAQEAEMMEIQMEEDMEGSNGAYKHAVGVAWEDSFRILLYMRSSADHLDRKKRVQLWIRCI